MDNVSTDEKADYGKLMENGRGSDDVVTTHTISEEKFLEHRKKLQLKLGAVSDEFTQLYQNYPNKEVYDAVVCLERAVASLN